jgi:hypothetical protein
VNKVDYEAKLSFSLPSLQATYPNLMPGGGADGPQMQLASALEALSCSIAF